MLDISYQANTFHISYQGKPLGKIHTYSNPYHQTNTYNLITAHKGTALYQRATQRLFDHYQTVHQNINPWTASQEDFDKDLPDLVHTDSENWAFVENNEVAYVCGKDEQSFDSFIQAIICQLFDQYEQISFEADNRDPIAMRLADHFRFPNKPSWDTYILES